MFKWEMQCFLIIQGKYDKDKNSCRTLEPEHGNREKTAQRPGISRSTLRRILKNNKV